MKNVLKGVLVALVAVSLVMGMASCGGGTSPKSLAKQWADTQTEIEKLMMQGDLDNPKIAELEKKQEGVLEKAGKLSEKDGDIFIEEMMKLGKEAGLFGF